MILGEFQQLGSEKEVNNDVPVVPMRQNRIDKEKQEHEPGYRHEQLDIIPHRTAPRLINGTVRKQLENFAAATSRRIWAVSTTDPAQLLCKR